VVRHRLLDGYSDDVLADLKGLTVRACPRVIVLMTADRDAHTEARQVSLGADCVLHDPVRSEILFEYLAKYRAQPGDPTLATSGSHVSFSIAGAEVHPHEHRMVRGDRARHLAPQEVALLRLLASAPNEVVPYAVLYGELFARRFDGDTSNCRVLLCKVLNSFKDLGIELKPYIQVIPKSGYLYSPAAVTSRKKAPRSRRQHPVRQSNGTASEGRIKPRGNR
jgi:DNA-binding response OmpR family regulator